MKIGIVTFWSSLDNYGQVLQSYALQQYLRMQGHEAYSIRYEERKPYPNIFMSHSFWALFQRMKKKVLHRKDYLLHRSVYEKNLMRNFDQFKERYIVYSDKRYYKLRELKKHPPKADMYVTGSDQVWGRNPEKQSEAPYYLKFGDNQTKRVAYAASLGPSTFFDNRLDLFRSLMAGIDYVSVREKSRLALFRESGITASWVLDPVFLLDAADYRLLSSGTSSRKSFVYVYAINITKASQMEYEDLQKYAREAGLDIVVTPSSGYFAFEELFSGAEYEYSTIEQWIDNINQAELVVTTSFHGIMFCLMFHKDFVFVPLRNSLAKGNSRVEDLLNDLNLNNRIWRDSYEKVLNHSIDWAFVDSRLSEWKKASCLFLSQCGC